MDAAIVSGRLAGFSWDVVAATVNVARYTAIKRGRDIGAALGVNRPISEGVAERYDDDRQPLRAGSVETWGEINSGTCIEGADYPAHSYSWAARAYAERALEADDAGDVA